MERVYQNFQVGICIGCGYERIIVDYSDRLFKILYPDNFESKAISESPIINEDIFHWTSEFIEQQDIQKIVDIGCGKLTFLKKLQQKYPKKNWLLYGIDHRAQSEVLSHPLNFVEADLLQMNNNDILKPLKFDFAYCIHTLEHIHNPRDALLAIKEKLKDGAHLYLEVPANEIVEKLSLCSVELFHPQHISYFSLRTLKLLARVCGLQVIKSETIITNGVPRAKIVVQNSQHTLEHSLVETQVKKIEELLSTLASRICSIIECGKTIAIWGCGYDLDKLFIMNNKLLEFARLNKLFFIDTNLKGKTYKGLTIATPNILLKKKEINIIVVPRLKTIRESIKKSIIDLDIDKERIVDQYDEFD